MTLDEQLAMANNNIAITPNSAQPAPQATQQVTTVTNSPQEFAQAQVVQPTQTVATMQQPTQLGAQPQAPGINIEQAAQEAEQTFVVQEIELGQKISTRAIESIQRMNPEDKIRITPLTKAVYPIPVHNHEELGKLICWSKRNEKNQVIAPAQCCKDMDEPRIRYCIPVMVYPTYPKDPTKILPGANAELRLLQIWDYAAYDNYCQEIMNYTLPDGTLPDLVATCKDTYGRLEFRAQQQSFRADPNMVQQVQEIQTAWTNIGPQKILPTVGRQLNDDRYLRLTQKASIPQMQQYSMEDAMN